MDSMNSTNGGAQSLVVTTNQGEYYVIPKSALAQFKATPEQKGQIDEAVDTKVPGTFAHLDAEEASAKPSYASTSRTTALAWFQNL